MSKIIFKGISVSSGVGIGGLFICQHPKILINREKISRDKVEDEIIKLETAFGKSCIEIYDLTINLDSALSREEKDILDVYNAILDDVFLFEELKDRISNELCTAENSIDLSMNRYIEELKNSGNEVIAERCHDLNDLRERLIRNANNGLGSNILDGINSSHIVALKELTPTVAMGLGKKRVKGVISTDGAGYLSHASIILRSLGIPTLNEIDFDAVAEYANKIAIVDSYESILIIDPDDNELSKFKDMVKIDEEDFAESDEELESLDGEKISLFANVNDIEDFKVAKKKKISGIGLIRTETLFMSYKRLPSEKRQSIIYSQFAKGMVPRKVFFRTLDMSGDKILYGISKGSKEENTIYKGIKWSLNNLDSFFSQLRSILKASNHGNVNVMFPMVEDEKEIKLCKIYIDEIKSQINCKTDLKIGVVIETQKAVENIDLILDEVDFISIGTNDLLQETLGIDRLRTSSTGNEFFEPEFIKTLNYITNKAKEKSLPVSICGEMAAHSKAVIILLAMGINELSVGPASIKLIKKIIKNINIKHVKKSLNKILEAKNPAEIIEIINHLQENKVFEYV